jgi:two-component system invasion response regulator UvrY
MPISVLLTDDNDIVRRVIRRLLEDGTEIQVVAEASSFGETIDLANRFKPQVIIMDLHMKDQDAFSPQVFKSKLHHHHPPIAAISVWNDEETTRLAQQFGAVTLLDKAKLASTLIPTIKQLASSNCSSGRAT